MPPVTPNAREADLWLPPRRLVRYQLVKIGAAAIALLIFAGWQVLRWSVPAMRVLTITLQVLTVWITIRSIVTDVRRSRGRQLALSGGELRGRRPDGAFAVRLADVDHAQWRHDTQDTLGLWLYDRQGNTLAHLDAGFVADEREARDFLHWARQKATLDFIVQWSSTDKP